MERVVLIQPPVRDFYLTRKRTLPYGLAAIAASLESAGFSCTIVDGLATDKSKPLPLPESFAPLAPFYGRTDISRFSLFSVFRHFGYSHEHLGHLARQEAPFVVGISSLFTPYADQAMATAAAVKKFCPEAWVVLGGHHPTAFAGDCLKNPHVDFVIKGEGEVPMAGLCTVLRAHAIVPGGIGGKWPEACLKDLRDVPGLAFKEEGRIISGDPFWAENLDALPLPAVEKTRSDFYRRGRKKAVTIAASRGCPFGCTYCSVSASSCHGRFRRRSVEKILEEIRQQSQQHDIGFIDLEDENLTLDRSWALELMAGLREMFEGRPVDVRAMNGLYPPSLDEEIITAMKAAGFRTLNLSVGSFSSGQLQKFGRPDVRKAHARVLEIARNKGLDTVSYIIGAAPDQQADTTLSDLMTLAALPTLAGLSIFYPAPGSVLWGRCRELGILPEQFEMMRSSALPLDQATTRLQAVTLLRLSRIINYLKSLADGRGSLPSPLPWIDGEAWELSALQRSGAELKEMDLRDHISLMLVRWFLWDGKIRGMDEDGNIYNHQTDISLCRAFLEKIRKLDFMGVTTGPYAFPLP